MTTGFLQSGRADRTSAAAPRIYYLHPWIDGTEGWDTAVRHAAELGFSHLLLAWPFGTPQDLFLTRNLDEIDGRSAEDRLRRLAEACSSSGLEFWLDLAIDRLSAESELAHADGSLWQRRAHAPLDPRSIDAAESLIPLLGEAGASRRFADYWAGHVSHWHALGVSGVHCHAAASLPKKLWSDILQPVRDQSGGTFSAFGWMSGASREQLAEYGEIFDFVTSSVAWWQGTERWLAEEYNLLAGSTHLIGFPEDPFASRHPAQLPSEPVRESQLRCASSALLADGWLLPMGFEYGMETPFLHAVAEDFQAAKRGTTDLRAAIADANRSAAELISAERRSLLPLRLTERATVVLRRSDAASQIVVLNRDAVNELSPDVAQTVAWHGLSVAPATEALTLPPASGALIDASASRPILEPEFPSLPERDRLAEARIAIEAVQPTVDGGRFPAKRSVGDVVEVSADIFSDGHEVLAAELLWRPQDERAWSRTPMQLVGNDRWQASFPLTRIGRHEFAIEAWWSEFGTFRRDLAKKRDAGLDIRLEVTEGRLMLEKFAADAEPEARQSIEQYRDRLGASQDEDAGLLLADDLASVMEKADQKPHATGGDRIFSIEADREAAAFSSWYELFPRSITDDPARHGTFRDVIGRLPAIQAMGFDVLYFPPIHPIGKTNRKGRNNSLVAGADDPGSPYAIGAPEGGHDAIHPELGSLDDFLALVKEAERHGLEIALDFAIQCSPDHPWLKQHPGWFSWRPDGSMRYAENPPKKYQDIVNVDFYAPGAIPGLWLALRDAVQFWVDQGVRIFRVDNPHTKPFPFWEWLIADIRSRDPRVLFLAEAFTRPKVMYRLGKVGFSQSYTYFTWRNTKYELTEYLTELNRAPARDVYRPHFFVNTPDINPVFLHNSGRPGFLIRAALAATLSGLWGVYSGFELCEAAPVPGKEEYLDSEKYEIKPRDWQAPGNIIAEITKLNAIRRDHPALQSHLGLTFYNASDDNILYFGKRAEPDGEIILVAINLDPHAAHAAQIEVPLWEFGLPDHASIDVADLMHGHRFSWHGKTQTIHLDPHAMPFSIWRIASSAGDRA